MSLLIIVIIFVLLFCIQQRDKIRASFQKKKNRLAGPNNYFLGGYVTALQFCDLRKFLGTVAEWSRKYGPVFQFHLGPFGITCLNSPEMIQKLLSSNNSSHHTRPFFYNALRPFLIDGLVLSQGDKWKSRRKAINKHMFSFATLHSYIQIFNEESEILINDLDERFKLNVSKKAEPIDDILFRSSLNIITQITLGKPLKHFEEGERSDNAFVEFVRKTRGIVATKIINPWFMLYPLWRLHPLFHVEQKTIKFLQKIAENCVLPAEENEESTCLFQKDMAAAGISREGIIEEALTLIVAGYETSASGIHFLLFFLSLHPNHQDICRKEVDEMFEDLENGYISFSALKKLKYLEMCVYETLRLLPPLPIFMRKLDSPLELDKDLTLPKNTVVGINVQAIHKNPKYFPNPEEFIPQRFTEEERNGRHPYAYLGFSAGVRNCVGYKFAMMEIVLLAAKILRHYVISTTDKLEDVVFLPHVTITPETPINFLLERRVL